MTPSLSWSLLEQLAEHGEELYLVDLAAVRRSFVEWRAALQAVYPKSEVAYSYKTNYTPAICRLVDELGGCAEVASSMELDLVERLRVAGPRVIFNGPYKQLADVERALCAGAMVFLDGLHEVDFVEAVAARDRRRMLRVGLRCHVEFEGSSPSRFGFDVGSPAFAEAVSRLTRLAGCSAVNLHAHYIPNGRRPAGFAAVCARLVEASALVPESHRPAMLDVGGGYYSRMPNSLLLPGEEPVPSPSEYAEAIGGVMRTAFPDRPRPTLVLEPGMALVADAMVVATRVVATKSLLDRRVAVVASTCYTVRPTFARRPMAIDVYPRPERSPETSDSMDIVGYTCMEDDCLVRGFNHPVAAGDWIVFRHAGAYTNVLRPAFIAPSPAIIALDDATGRAVVVKRRETFDDAFATYFMELPRAVDSPLVSR
jgi:diaminopimelate decarboxylase